MISIHKLAINFTGDFLFKDLSFVVGDRERIGLVGKNGAGKSTLLKIIHKEIEPEAGTMVITAGFKTGYLPQEMATNFSRNVWEETISAFVEQKQLEKQIAHITEQLSLREDYESEAYHKLAQQLSDFTERFHILGGSTMDADAEKVLLGLGFKQTDFMRPLHEFSSGWQMRVALAKILLQKPEIILLDEPTNHLDIESIQWLEEYLANYEGALIMVSHDRTFLDRVTTRTIEITLGNIQDYKCSYSEYVEQRLERIETQQAAFENQQKEVAQIERFIERFRYKATKAKQVQSRIKLLDKMDKIVVDEVDDSAISFRFPPAPHSGKVTVETKQLSLGYGDFNVLKDIDMHLERGERVAFVGRNGEGKSTFVKSIVGELAPQSGVIQLGHQVVIGYYAQNQALLLNPNKTVFETIDEVAVGDIRPKIRTILGRFLFSTEDTEKKVAVLSGGEKSRLALAKLLLSPFNLLILDEPTNHLDMASKDVLKNALLHYTGSLIVVSHDRDFLAGLCEKIFEFKDKKIKTYIGDVFDFLEKKKLDSLNELQRKANSGVLEDKQTSVNKENYLLKKEQDAQQRKFQNQLKKLENEIENEMKLLHQIEMKLALPEQYAQEIENGALYAEYEKLKHSIAEKEEKWLELQEQ
ncbi:MAG: ABC-F family ATP-binding cassette domain-containing protein [Bacteroidetes bacterium]|nr:ABC-F family ATP-binding cassette domain-containing protein [Bacteroidota bacterium]MCL1968857.1 ABC-F family ATP-binding cassette domain-containing protein [Bacteroidota bacterium]